MVSPTGDRHAAGGPPSVEEVSAGVFGYVQPDGSWGLNNTGFIVGRRDVLAIDACFTEQRTRALLRAISSRAPERLVRALVNTHHHGDHTFGNYLFLPQATIIAHELCRASVIADGLGAQRMFPGVEWGRIEIAPPTATFSDRMELWVGDVHVQLIFVGPAHTTNDIIAWLPERKVLFSGDVLFHRGTPFALMGSIAGWLEALERLRALGATTIVPGHGAVCGGEVIDDVEAYLRFVQDAARRGFDAGVEPLEAARSVDPGRFAEWADSERLVANIHRAYSELRGEPRARPLAPQAIADMITMNGGQPVRCLA